MWILGRFLGRGNSVQKHGGKSLCSRSCGWGGARGIGEGEARCMCAGVRA